MFGLAPLLRELFIQGGVHVFTSGPAEDSSRDSPTVGTVIAPSGDVVVKVSRGVRTDGSVWAAHVEAVRARLAPLYAFRALLRSAEVWIVRGTVIAALISTAAAIADAQSPWPQRLLRIGVPAVAALLIRLYRRRVVAFLAVVLLRRLLRGWA